MTTTVGFELLPVTAMQQALLSPALLGPANGFDVEQVIWSIEEWLDFPSLQQAWRVLHERHDALRLSFIWEGQVEPRQVVNPAAAPIIARRALEGDEPAQAATLERFLEEDRRTPFSFLNAPLSRLTVLSAAVDRHHLVWSFPHVLLDGRSISIILAEMIKIYDSLCAGLQPALEPAPAFTDYLHFRAGVGPVSADFWRGLLGDFHKANGFPHDPDASVVQADYLPVEVDIPYAHAECEQIRITAERLGVTVNDMLQGAWSVVLAAQSGDRDVVFGSIRACRHAGPEHVRQACGVFMNCLPKRAHVDPGRTVKELVTGLHRQQLAMRAHELDPLEQVIRHSGIPPGERLFDSLMMVDREPVHASASTILGHRRHGFRLIEKPAITVAVLFTMIPRLASKMIVDPRRVSRDGALRLLRQLKATLLDMAERPQARLSELRLMPECERAALVEAYNASEAPFDSVSCLHHLFEAQADRAPNRIAVIEAGRRLSYRQVESQANQLAHHLIANGVTPGNVVALRLERSADMVIALLAVLKAGAAYVPLDVSYPFERVRYVLDSTGAAALITRAEHEVNAPCHPTTIVLDRDATVIAGRSDARPDVSTGSERLAYIIFTSGSTGTPKGVMIDHRGAVNTIIDCNTRFKVTANDRIFAISAYTFDLSVYDIFGMLAAGASVVLCPNQAARSPETWGELVRQEGVTIWNSVPALVEMLVESHRGKPAVLASLRLVMMSGDRIPVSLPPLLGSLLPRAQQFSLGGATEASIWSIIHPIQPTDHRRNSIPYGRPMANQQFYVLDAHLRPCPTLVSGDLYIGGVGLAMGYWKDPEKTAASFIQHPTLGRRLYRTGDQGRFLPDGVIEFLGRCDGQVKLNGFRIELGEIEAAIRRLPWVRECVATIREDSPGNRYLAAYVMGHAQSAHALDELPAHCRSCLPTYMVPAVFMAVEQFPLSANGKVDRKVLPMPKVAREDVGTVTWSREEILVADLWEQMLGVRPDHPERTFFECGGNSLAAIRLVGLVERECARRLPLAAVFEAPSVRQFAALMKPEPVQTVEKLIVPLQPGGTRPPFFLISEYMDIGRFIDRHQPLYGLFVGAPILVQQPHLAFADVARLCLEEMRRVQPTGPYFIGGHCFGAVVAFQVAMELSAHGERVAYLGMMDPPAPTAIGPPDESQLDRYLYYLRSVLGRNPLHIPGYIARGLRNRRFLRERRLLGHDPERIFSSFVPQRIQLTVDMFFAKDSYYRYRPERDPRLAWAKWCNGLVIHETAGGHITFCREPAVQKLARLLSDRLELAQGRPHGALAAAG